MAAKIALPANAKIAALVCSGRSRPKLSWGNPTLGSGRTSIRARHKPISAPTAPPPHHGREQELADACVVVTELLDTGGHRLAPQQEPCLLLRGAGPRGFLPRRPRPTSGSPFRPGAKSASGPDLRAQSARPRSSIS